MPYSRKTGRRYAAGSTTTLGGWEPKTCSICGEKIVISGERALEFYFDHVAQEGFSYHADCKKKPQEETS